MAKITDLNQNLVGGNGKTNLVGDTSITVEPVKLKAKSVLQILKHFESYILEHAKKGDQGAPGLSIIGVNVTLVGTGDAGSTYRLTCTLSDGSSINAGTFFSAKGSKGDKGDKGDTGLTGNGISTIAKISTVGLVDTYRITFTDGTYFDYEIKNGEDSTLIYVNGVVVDTISFTSDPQTQLDNKVDLTSAQTITGKKTIRNVLEFQQSSDSGGTTKLEIKNDNGYNAKIRMGNTENIRLMTGGTYFGATVAPISDHATDLGVSSTNRWRNIILSGAVDFGDGATILKDSSNRINLCYANSPKVKVGSAETIIANRIGADSDNSQDIGRSTVRWANIYLAGNLSDGTISIPIAQIATLTDIANIKTIKAEIVANLPTADATTYFNESKTIYMTAIAGGSGNDYYNEYITVRTGSEGSYVYSWEKIGTTQIDLSGYLQKSNDIKKLYGTGSTAGSQMMWTINNDGTVGNAICQRDSSGSVVVPTPTADDQSAPKKYVDDGLNTKEDTISDLATIRSGAAAGATAVQPSAAAGATAVQPSALLDFVYPVGSYFITESSSFSTVAQVEAHFGGTWQMIPAGYALWTADSGAGNTISAGLPNIKGTLPKCIGVYDGNTPTGAFTKAGRDADNGGYANYYGRGSYNFNANSGATTSGIYRDDVTTVQPPARKVYAYKRTA